MHYGHLNDGDAPASRKGRISGMRWRLPATVAFAGAALVSIMAPSVATAATVANSFSQTNLVANKASYNAKLVDPNLTNAWGLALAPGVPLWVSDNNSGNASVYSGGINGSGVSLDLTVPVPGGNPTGQVFNPTVGMSAKHQAFQVGGPTGNPADFIVSSDSIGSSQSPGEIAAWDGGPSFVVEDSPTGGPGGTTPTGAIFKGLAVSTKPKAGPELLATDVANATVDVFDRHFAPVNAPSEFKDPSIPAGFAPFGIQVLGNKVFVSYAMQNSTKTDVVPGAGLGFVDVYKADGQLMRHLISGGSTSPLNEPWGLAIAPQGFGPFSGKLLVGNLGNGEINAFSPGNGKFLGTLRKANGTPIVIDGLWALSQGNTQFGGPSSLLFSAGPSAGGVQYADGLVGTLTPTP